MIAGVRQLMTQGHHGGPLCFAGNGEKPEAPNYGPLPLDAFFKNPQSNLLKLSRQLKDHVTGPDDEKIAANFLNLLLKTSYPESAAYDVLQLFRTQEVSGMFPLLEVFTESYQTKPLSEQSFSLLKLLSLTAEKNQSALNRHLARTYAHSMLQSPQAEIIARQMLASYDELIGKTTQPPQSTAAKIHTLRKLEEALVCGPVDRINNKLKSLFNTKTQGELQCIQDYRTLLQSAHSLDNLILFLADMLRLNQETGSLGDIIGLTGAKLLETLDAQAADTRGGIPETPGKTPTPAEEEARRKLLMRQTTFLALSAVQQFRKVELQPPDSVLEALLSRMNGPPVSLRGRDIPHNYTRPVFTPVWETRYLEAFLSHNRSATFAFDVLNAQSGKTPVAEKALHNILSLLREPSFAWDVKDPYNNHDSIAILGQAVREAGKRGNETFYEAVRQIIFDLAEIDSPHKETEKAHDFPRMKLPNPSDNLLSGAAVAHRLVYHLSVETRQNVPDDLLLPLITKASLAGMPLHIAPVEPEPPPAEVPSQPDKPALKTGPPKKKLGWFDTLMEYLAWRRIKK